MWVEKYRPEKVSDCLLSADLMAKFKGFVKAKGKPFPNLIFHGSSGVGKTTVAKALCREKNYPFMFINGSLNGGIDTLRSEIISFLENDSIVSNFSEASPLLVDDSYKVVILDEADHLSNSTMAALRGILEETHDKARFIFTCNNLVKISPAIRSRCDVIEFTFTNSSKDFKKRAHAILKSIMEREGIDPSEYKKKTIEFINSNWPDMRAIINAAQYWLETIGKENVPSIEEQKGFDEIANAVFDAIQSNDFNKMVNISRNTVNAGNHFDLFKSLLTIGSSRITPETIPFLIKFLAECQSEITNVPYPPLSFLNAMIKIATNCKIAKPSSSEG